MARLDATCVALRFSILTPTLDRCAMLREAMASVRAQNWPAVEHVIADGGSTDGTVDMLADAPDVRLIQGPDGGIYEGLNKAVAAAQGDVIGWLNSDDLYLPGTFAAAAAVFEAEPDVIAVCGGVSIEEGRAIERIYSPDLVADLSPGAVLIGPTLPNAWFFRRGVFDRVGVFSTDLRFAADSDFMQRFARLAPRIAAAPALFYRYRRHPGSATLRDYSAPHAVRLDMLNLALKWRDDPDGRVRNVARSLEGRCRTALTLTALARADVRAAAAHLIHAPTIARGIADYAARRLSLRLRRRRLGASSL